jgi:two-component system sensor histidine kinase YesM
MWEKETYKMKLRIRAKILLSTSFLVVISISLCALFAYQYFKAILKEQAIKDNTEKLNRTSYQLNLLHNDVKSLAEDIITDREIGKLIRANPNMSIEEEFNNELHIISSLAGFVILRDFVQNIIIKREDGKIFSNVSGFEDYYRSKMQELWLQDFLSKQKNKGFTDKHFVYTRTSENTEVVSYAFKFKNIQDNYKTNNLLVIDIKYSYLSNILDLSKNEFELAALIDESSNILYGNKELLDRYQKYISAGNLNNKGYFEDEEGTILYDRLDESGWTQIVFLSNDKLYSKLNKILTYFLFMLLIGVVFIIIAMLPVISSITRPIPKLVDVMKQVSEGNLDTFVDIKSGDELQLLGSGFNNMIQDLNKYIQDSIENEKMHRKMQIDLLISQINPHFIYNTLNTIIYMCHAGKNADAVKITEAFIEILQDTIKIGDDSIFATVQEEITVIERYLCIQQYRYPEKFVVKWNLDKNIIEHKIPKMIIQPIVENALFHGICPSDNFGLIDISITKQDEHMSITVKDNGIGLSEEKLKAIFQSESKTRTSNKTRGIGLKNIKNRIEFIYGEDQDIYVQSKAKEGTYVTIVLPLQYKDK